ncbi:MAG: tRNA(Ile)(2)-agmatinylcytidine synthase [Thermoplasmata archaeon]
MWIGIDDTDSPRGGCTTYAMTEVLRTAREEGIDVIGEPRLVRLNPNAPWKTRGNAALAARFGVGRGRPRTIGSVDGAPLRCYPAGSPLPEARARAWIDRAWSVVLESSRRGEPGTDPALVASPRRLPSSLYWDAVRSFVDPEARRKELARLGAEWRTDGEIRGLVGASAAIAWPARRRTWEAVAYRPRARWGRPRRVDGRSVARAQREEDRLFLCVDRRTRRVMVAPHTPCPILFGLRATDPRAALRAVGRIRSEPWERSTLFVTNQATGDHIVPLPAGAEAVPGSTVRFRGIVDGTPAEMPGGHVRLPLRRPDGGRLVAWAFEPTKTLPSLARRLVPGDRLLVWGSVGDDRAVRLEGVGVRRWARARGPARPPRCARCDRPARSLGRLRGYRCPSCHRRWPPEAARRESGPAPAPLGTYHPTPSARRHLHPLAPEPGPLPPGPMG